MWYEAARLDAVPCGWCVIPLCSEPSWDVLVICGMGMCDGDVHGHGDVPWGRAQSTPGLPVASCCCPTPCRWVPARCWRCLCRSPASAEAVARSKTRANPTRLRFS